MHRVNIDCFSSLDDVPKKLRGQELQDAVLAVLRQKKMFSCFEVEGRIGSVLTDLERTGRIRCDTTSIGYPWTAVEVIAP